MHDAYGRRWNSPSNKTRADIPFRAAGIAIREEAYTVPASELFVGRRRLDGYHYNPAAEVALHALQASKLPIVALMDVTHDVFGVPRFKHVYTATGIQYVDSEDIFKINPELTKFIPPSSKKDSARYHVKRGWLLMASSGQLYGVNGSVVLADRWHEGKILSNHIVRIVPKGIRGGYLQMALGHPTYGRPLVQRLAFGTEVPEIGPSDLASFPVVCVGAAPENAIADAVERASALRMQADDEENMTVDRVEHFLDAILARGGMLDVEIEATVTPQTARG